MRRDEAAFYEGKLKELQAQKKQLLVDMELQRMTKDPETFSAWWIDEGNFSRVRALSEEIEKLSNLLERSEITDDAGPGRMFPRGGGKGL
ncbi:MAG: hypothetical protein ACI4OJ_11470 [Lachnospiraceae bacterium]